MRLIHRSPGRTLLLLTAAFVVTATGASAQAERSLSLGLELELGAGGWDVPPVVPAIDAEPGDAPWVELRVAEREVDWPRVDETVGLLARSGYRISLILDPRRADGSLPGVTNAGSLESWTAFVREAVRRHGERVGSFRLGDRLPPAAQIDAYQFLLKTTALAARAEAERAGHTILLAQAELGPGDLAAQRALWERGSAAYVDVLPVSVDGQAASLDALAEIVAESALHPPAATVWAIARGGDPRSTEGFFGRGALALQALTRGAETALVGLSHDAPSLPELAIWTTRVHAALGDGFAAAPLGTASMRGPDGGDSDGRVLARFFSGDDFATLVFYALPGSSEEIPRERLIVDTRFIKDVEVLDFVGNKTLSSGSAALPDGARGRMIRVAPGELPRAVRFVQAVAGDFEIPPEQIETQRGRELTADEIIARHQQVRAVQDDKLERWIAEGRIDLHFKLAQGGASVDLSIDSTYFWERGQPLEWEQTRYYINGNAVKWKSFPELPLIQPEKVVTLPLDLTLDRTYGYRAAGRDRVGEREAYVLQFQPTDPDAPASLYRGRIWIDTETFRLLKSAVVQTQLESPVLSNDEVDTFAPREADDGGRYWLLDRIDGQQTWNTLGRTFVVRREVSFETYRINPPPAEFNERRDAAYASNNQMLRDTEEGFRYLAATDEGGREVSDQVDTSQLFAAVGGLSDAGGDFVPLAGVNWFDYDLGGRDIQANVFFAGAVAFANASKPDIGGGFDLTVDLSAWAIKRQVEFFSADTEIQALKVDTRPQALRLRLGRSLGQYWKVNLVGGLTHREYSANDDAQAVLDVFNSAPGATQEIVNRTPADHFETTGRLELEYNRRGWSVTAQYESGSRSDWTPFGLFDETAGQPVAFDPQGNGFVATAEPELFDSFARYKATLFKEWYFGNFQKLRAEASRLGGEDLDAFSRYQFGFFGDDRLWGFSGTGVRFDEGTIGRVGYSFNLFEVLRFDLAVDHAEVEQDLAGAQAQSFTGAGLAANFVGPWKTVFAVQVGHSLASDIPELEGETEFFATVLKLF